MTAEFAPAQIRYLKLGQGGRWERRALDAGELHFGYASVPHELCLAGDWEAVARALTAQEGRSRGKASDAVREIRDFYTLGPDCLWVAFAEGHLWWAFAQPEPIWLGGDGATHGSRMRRTVAGWRNTDLQGRPLRMDGLSTRLTQVAAYRQTICRIAASDYLLRRIRGEEEPAVAQARAAQAALIAAAEAMIADLHWAEFELLCDLIFARSGWERVSAVGGAQKDVDLVLRQPATGESAFVQVKSRASQAVLDDYVVRFRAAGAHDRLFFLCHSPDGPLAASDDGAVQLWAGPALAAAAVRAGLYDWLMKKAA